MVCSTDSLFDEKVPNWLTGVWRRLSIEENGDRDTTTRVFWLQTSCCFGDIRIPAERSAQAMDRQDGFAGVTRLKGDLCTWHHTMDYLPDAEATDVGRLYWQGDILVEMGPEDAYKEEWQRVATGPTAAMTLFDDLVWQGWLVVCGDWFIYTQKRSPEFDSLASPTCEISMGRIQSASQFWEIQLSTLPEREGRSLWSPADLAVDVQSNQVVQTVGDRTLTWTVQEWGELAQLLSAPSPKLS